MPSVEQADAGLGVALADHAEPGLAVLVVIAVEALTARAGPSGGVAGELGGAVPVVLALAGAAAQVGLAGLAGPTVGVGAATLEAAPGPAGAGLSLADEARSLAGALAVVGTGLQRIEAAR